MKFKKIKSIETLFVVNILLCFCTCRTIKSSSMLKKKSPIDNSKNIINVSANTLSHYENGFKCGLTKNDRSTKNDFDKKSNDNSPVTFETIENSGVSISSQSKCKTNTKHIKNDDFGNISKDMYEMFSGKKDKCKCCCLNLSIDTKTICCFCNYGKTNIDENTIKILQDYHYKFYYKNKEYIEEYNDIYNIGIFDCLFCCCSVKYTRYVADNKVLSLNKKDNQIKKVIVNNMIDHLRDSPARSSLNNAKKDKNNEDLLLEEDIEIR